MFIQSAFIRKNSPKLRQYLDTIGYKYGGKASKFEQPYLYCSLDKYFECNSFPARYHGIIDCAENEDLFLALAALRDDSDYMQWFMCPKTRTRRMSGYFGQIVGMDGHYQEIVGYEWHRHENNDNALTKKLNAMMQMEGENMEFLPHKATVEELIEHFK